MGIVSDFNKTLVKTKEYFVRGFKFDDKMVRYQPHTMSEDKRPRDDNRLNFNKRRVVANFHEIYDLQRYR